MAFYTEGKCRSDLFLDVETYQAAHITEEGCVLEGGGNTTIETY